MLNLPFLNISEHIQTNKNTGKMKKTQGRNFVPNITQQVEKKGVKMMEKTYDGGYVSVTPCYTYLFIVFCFECFTK